MGLACGGTAQEDAAVAVGGGFEFEFEFVVFVGSGGAEPGVGAFVDGDDAVFDAEVGTAFVDPAVESFAVKQGGELGAEE